MELHSVKKQIQRFVFWVITAEIFCNEKAIPEINYVNKKNGATPRFLMFATNLGATAHQGLQLLWNIHTAICILMIFQYRNQCTWYGDARIIQCRNVLNIAICIAISGVCAARLELADG